MPLKTKRLKNIYKMVKQLLIRVRTLLLLTVKRVTVGIKANVQEFVKRKEWFPKWK